METSTACSDDMPTIRPLMRRSHKKSRFGCKECKLRHMKCDETQPSCVNCATASMKCSLQYLSIRPTTIAKQTYSTAGTPSPLGGLCSTPAVGGSIALSGQQFSMHHLELLHYFESRLPEKAHKSIHISRQIAVFFIESAFNASYLMYQILAFSALQLSTERPASMQYYRREATELQTRALALFNAEAAGGSPYQALETFLFSMLLCHQHVFETFSLRCPLPKFADQFASCLRLLQGLRALSGIHWQTILTQLQPYFGSEVISSFRPGENPEANEYYKLLDLLAGSTLNVESRMTYERCVELLCWIYQFRRDPVVQRNRVVWAWLDAPSVIFLRNGHVLESIQGSDPARFRDAFDRHAGVKPIDNSATLAPEQEQLKEVPIARLTELVQAAPVMLFMKGTPKSPQCRCSRRMISLLRDHNIDYDSSNVLADEDVHQGLKEFGDWPTFPQSWVDGKLVGGLEIVREELRADPDFIKDYSVRRAAAQENTT